MKYEIQTNNVKQREEMKILRKGVEMVMEEQDKEHRRNDMINQELEVGDDKIKEDTEKFLNVKLELESAPGKVGRRGDTNLSKIDTNKK